jgi:hypothetical protein
MKTQIINDDPSSYQLIGGEIISKIYFQQLAKEINLIVKWDGFATYATLSSRFHLPMEFISQVIRDHIGTIIRGTLRVSVTSLPTISNPFPLTEQYDIFGKSPPKTMCSIARILPWNSEASSNFPSLIFDQWNGRNRSF